MITVINPSYNHENYILECLKGAAEIDIPSKKIIVIDDGSTDDTPVVVQEFIDGPGVGQGITLIQKENSGLISSLNLGLSMVDTEFLYLVASDDVPMAKGIEEILCLFYKSANQKFIIAGGYNLFMSGQTTPVYTEKHKLFFELPVELRDREMFLNFPSPILLQSTIFRTSALRKIGGWDTNLKLDDYPMIVKLLRAFPDKDKDFNFIPLIPVVKYRHHGNNTYKNIEKQFFMVRETYACLAPQDIRNKAIGYRLGYYCLKSFASFKLRTVIILIFSSPMGSWGWAMIGIFKVVIDKVWSKFK